MVLQRCEKKTQHHCSCWEVVKKERTSARFRVQSGENDCCWFLLTQKMEELNHFFNLELSWKTREDIKRAITKPASFETLRS